MTKATTTVHAVTITTTSDVGKHCAPNTATSDDVNLFHADRSRPWATSSVNLLLQPHGLVCKPRSWKALKW